MAGIIEKIKNIFSKYVSKCSCGPKKGESKEPREEKDAEEKTDEKNDH